MFNFKTTTTGETDMGFLKQPVKKLQRSTFRTHRSRIRSLLRFESLEERDLMAVVSHWTADNNTANDSSGTNHGTLLNGAGYTSGQVGQAFSFDGIDDRIGVSDSTTLALTGSISIEAWVKANTYPTLGSGHGLILFRGDDRGGLDPYQLTLQEGGTVAFSVNSLTGGATVSAPLPLGQFVHVVGTLDDSTGVMGLYLNGMLVSQGATSVRPFGALDPASNPGVGIGSHGGYPTTPHKFLFNGLIDELKLYNHALSQAEVLSNFNATKGDLLPAISISDGEVIEGESRVKYIGNFIEPMQGGMDDPYQMVYGPDGHLYVSSLVGSKVLRFDGVTGASLPAVGKIGAEFVSPGAGGLDAARSIAFGPNGNLYVANANGDSVLRFDGTTGQPLGALVSAGAGGLNQPRGLLFHAGHLYVTSVQEGSPAYGLDAILRYDAVTGAPAGKSGAAGDAVFIPSGDHGLDNPSQIIFHNGDFYVASTAVTAPSTSNSVLRYDASGTFRDVFVPNSSGGLSGPVDIDFYGGLLYVTSFANNKVLRYNGTTGVFVDEVASGSGLLRPLGLLFASNGDFLVTSSNSDEIRRYSVNQADFSIAFRVTIAPWSSSVTVDYSTANGSAFALFDYVTTSGSITFAPGITSRTIHVPTLNDTMAESTESFYVNLFNLSGAIIADDRGTGTIVDDETPPTKFFVVDDASTNKTFEYAAKGTALENYSLVSGNSLPRGAASTAAGNKIWVVDANKKVYVYNDAGLLLGSWSAGSLAGNASIEGIATNGIDVWLVDARQDRIFYYPDAARRLSGSQPASNSYPLRSANVNPKDIVTDGINLWVVDSGWGTILPQVFKYSVNGSWIGSWTIDTANSKPTGLTIDPTGASQSIWIVDSGTDRVYEYVNIRGKDFGTYYSAKSFALAPGNTNPQGIADPPPLSASLNTTPGSAVSNSSSSSSFMQAPIVLLGASSIERASLRSLMAVTEGVDQFMSRFSALPAEPTRVSNAQSIPVLSRPRFAEEQSIDLALADEELSESLDSIANDLLESTIR